MTEWWHHLSRDPLAVALLVLVAATIAVPVSVMIWRLGRMLTGRGRETDVTENEPAAAEPQSTTEDLRDRLPAEDATIIPLPPPEQIQRIRPMARVRSDQEIDEEQRQRWGRAGFDPPGGEMVISEVQTARATFGVGERVPEPLVRLVREPCAHCDGRGYMAGLNDLLKESAALLGDQGDEVVRLFYSALFKEDPDLIALFPGDPREGDLGTDHRGVQVRELLLAAVLGIAEYYDPGNPEKMGRLRKLAEAWGRKHAAFARRDGTVRPATLEEYASVKHALFTTLVRVAAEKWRPEYTEAWSRAYDCVAGWMISEQHASAFTAPRFARS